MSIRVPLLNDAPDDGRWLPGQYVSSEHSVLELIDDHPADCRQCALPEHPAKRGVVWSQVIPSDADGVTSPTKGAQ